jgi:hypothetical protein
VELKLSPRRLLGILAATGVAVAVVLAMTLSSSTASAAVNHKNHKHAVHHAAQADPPGASEANEPAGAADEPKETAGENVKADPDGPAGPDVGGDHQCPPACSPGESG